MHRLWIVNHHMTRCLTRHYILWDMTLNNYMICFEYLIHMLDMQTIRQSQM